MQPSDRLRPQFSVAIGISHCGYRTLEPHYLGELLHGAQLLQFLTRKPFPVLIQPVTRPQCNIKHYNNPSIHNNARSQSQVFIPQYQENKLPCRCSLPYRHGLQYQQLGVLRCMSERNTRKFNNL